MLYKKIFAEIGGVEVDNRTRHQDKIFQSLEEALKYKDQFPGLKDAQSAKVGDYVTIKLDDTYRIIIKGADHAAVRREFLGDKTEYTYSASFRIAEFHGYIAFKNLLSNEEVIIGGSVLIPGEMKGTWIVRNDVHYDKKYFRGTVTEPSPKPNKASLAVDFLITKKQYQDLSLKLHEHHQSIPADNQNFAFTGNNCHDFARKVYNDLGFQGHPLHFVQSQHIDFNDMGGFWLFLLAYTSTDLDFRGDQLDIVLKFLTNSENWLFLYNLDVIPKIIWDNPDSYLPGFLEADAYALKYLDWCYYYYYCSDRVERANIPDKYGNNAIHKALLMKDISSAWEYLEMGVDSNAANAKGETALHLAAGLEPSPEKLQLLEALIAKADDINQPDLYADNLPVTFALRADDPDAVRLLFKHGADLHFINGTRDSLANLLMEERVVPKAAVQVLYELAPEIFAIDSFTRQYPIHHVKIQGLFPITEDAPPPKTLAQEHNIIEKLLDHLTPLIEPSIPDSTLDTA